MLRLLLLLLGCTLSLTFRLKWALLHRGIQVLRALSSNVHEPGQKTACNPQSFEVVLEGQELKYT